MNIAIFIGGLGTGGAERVVCNLSNYLSKRHKLTIITMGTVTPSYNLNNDISLITLSPEGCKDNFVVKNIKRIIKLNKIIKQNNQDIFLSFLPVPSFLLLSLRKKIKVPIVVSVRNDPKIEYASRISNLIMKLLYPSANGFVFQTEEAKEYFNNIIKVDSTIIPNPINEEFIKEEDNELKKKIIVSVGRLSEQKNYMLLINAFSKVASKYSDYKLIIYGEGSLRSDLGNRIEELNLKDRVELPGNVTDIKKHIKDASLFVLPSDYEGMPNALMEAMALGLPVISTDCPCGGPKFLIENGKNGILVSVKDCDSMVKAMDRILEDDSFSNQIGQEAAKIVETLNPDKIYKIWEGYITSFKKNTKKEQYNNDK